MEEKETFGIIRTLEQVIIANEAVPKGGKVCDSKSY
jgi:hypothetical protein